MFRSSQTNQYVNIKETLRKLDQEQLFVKYAGISPNTHQRYYSLFRTDRKPECRFIWHSGILLFKDNGTYAGKLYFDIVETISILKHCSTKDAINIILTENNLTNDVVFQKEHVENIRIKPEIRFKHKPFDNDNLFGLNPQVLDYEHVYLVTDYWIHRGSDWEYNCIHNPRKTTCIAYYFPHSNNVKLYFPYEKTFRFFTNCDEKDVYGMYKLDYYLERDDRLLIITKSQKDRLLLDYVYGYNTIAVQSESSINLTEDLFTKINKFKDKLVLFDYDNTGQTYGSKLADKLNCSWINLEIAKDVYDATQKYNIKNTSIFLKNKIK